MEFITIKDEKEKIYTIENNINNKYIINLLDRNKITNSVTDVITFDVDTIVPLRQILDNDQLIKKFIYDIGSQMLYLKDEKLAIKYFSVDDIVVINSDIFLFINPNKLFALLNKKNIKLDISVKSYDYGIIDPTLIKLDEPFLPPELKEKNIYIFYTSSFYSLAKLLLFIFNFELESLHYTSLSFFLIRCLERVPEDRIFLYI